MQWRSLFGVDAEHIDQLEIIRRAERMAAEAAEPMTAWLGANVKNIGFNGQGLTPEKLNYQARLLSRHPGDRCGEGVGLRRDQVHAGPEQQLRAAVPLRFVPAQSLRRRRRKEPVAMACEADADGALTMQVLKHVSGGVPPFFGDLSYLNESTHTLYLPNCGAVCSWYAGRSDVPAENLMHIELRPSVRPGGAAITYFKAAPGPMTLARLFRRAGKYVMAIIPGEAVAPTDEEYAAFVAARGAPIAHRVRQGDSGLRPYHRRIRRQPHLRRGRVVCGGAGAVLRVVGYYADCVGVGQLEFVMLSGLATQRSPRQASSEASPIADETLRWRCAVMEREPSTRSG